MDKLRTFKHSGIYGFNEDEGRWMWSDTGSFEKESRGDMVRVTNPNGLNLAAPTSAVTLQRLLGTQTGHDNGTAGNKNSFRRQKVPAGIGAAELPSVNSTLRDVFAALQY